MNENDIFLAIGDIDNIYIEDAESFSAKKSGGKKTVLKIVSAAAAFTVIAASVAAFVGHNETLPDVQTESKVPGTHIAINTTEPTAASETNTQTATAPVPVIDDEALPVPHWEERSVNDKYNTVDINRYEYFVSNVAVSHSYIGEKRYDVKAHGYDIYTEKTYYTDAEVYEIIGVDTGCAVAVKYPGSEEYYAARCESAEFKDLGDFIDRLSLKEYLTVWNEFTYDLWTNGNYQGFAVSVPDTSIIWSMLLDDRSAVNIGSSDGTDVGDWLMVVGADYFPSGDINHSITLYGNGYVSTNIMGTEKCFYVGQEKVMNFTEYVKNNGTIIRTYNYEYPQSVNGTAEPETVQSFSQPYIPQVGTD